MNFLWIRASIAKKTYILVDFEGGAGVQTPSISSLFFLMQLYISSHGIQSG